MRLLRIFATASSLLVSQANPSLNPETLNENHCLEVCKAEKPTCPPYWRPEIVYQKGPNKMEMDEEFLLVSTVYGWYLSILTMRGGVPVLLWQASQNIKRVKHLLPFRSSIQAANGSTMKKVVPLYERV
ncbi:uncharacterized protein CIMG_12814 [Coccidioides immitis RS]|uniref:Uncharacterized protein n=1 Tax=Coccidioides immitis (strain RS) TaxID=246410 RepID=A0A0D8JSH9_COCIM|nr:uncharacterized protein CIMG_12814 [Coccidioides immitis RS]KJF60232.1 hypothetical protein CIMG_12814 [Coccidioides immitis RS]